MQISISCCRLALMLTRYSHLHRQWTSIENCQIFMTQWQVLLHPYNARRNLMNILTKLLLSHTKVACILWCPTLSGCWQTFNWILVIKVERSVWSTNYLVVIWLLSAGHYLLDHSLNGIWSWHCALSLLTVFDFPKPATILPHQNFCLLFLWQHQSNKRASCHQFNQLQLIGW